MIRLTFQLEDIKIDTDLSDGENTAIDKSLCKQPDIASGLNFLALLYHRCEGSGIGEVQI